jgi:hypothetical protein
LRNADPISPRKAIENLCKGYESRKMVRAKCKRIAGKQREEIRGFD